MKWRRPGAQPGEVRPTYRSQDDLVAIDRSARERGRFARNLTRSVFGRFYWDDRLAEELAADRKPRRGR